MTDLPDAIPQKGRLALRVWRAFGLVQTQRRKRPLPELVEYLSQTAPRAGVHHPPRRVSRAVDRMLRVGSVRPRCLTSALVLYRLLREQGEPVELVIGMPEHPDDHDAHAWVELHGRDVGPPPGKGHHRELTRYPVAAP